jgi:hypothetical protein
MGPSLLFSKEADGFLHRGGLNQMETQESLFCQWLALGKSGELKVRRADGHGCFSFIECFPESERVISQFHAGPPTISFGHNHRMKVDCALSMEARDGRRRLALYQYHGCRWHFGGHDLDCGGMPKRTKGQETEREDELKRILAENLSKVDPNLWITYESVNECQLFCRQDFNASERLIGCRALPRPGMGLRDVLSRLHPKDSLLGIRTSKISPEALLQKIRDSPYNFQGGTEGGFLTISEGTEGDETPQEGVSSDMMGFCLQRNPVPLDQIGDFTAFQASEMHRDCADPAQREARAQKTLRDISKLDQTLVRSGFASTESVGWDYLKWLMENRSFRNFKIHHWVAFIQKDWITPWVTELLQRRRTCVLEGPKPGNALKSAIYKLILNSFYGYCSMSQTSFSKTSIMTEEYLSKHRRALGGLAGALQVTLLGAVESSKPEERPPSLLYAVTWSKRNDRIENISQVSACILSNSRKIYLDGVLKILRALCPKKSEGLYCDTDSFLVCHSQPLLEDCVRKENAEENLALLSSVMEDLTSPVEQSGFFKLEGVFDSGFMR